MSDSCPIIDQTKLNIALDNVKKAGIDLSELSDNCPIDSNSSGGRKRRVKKGGAIRLTRAQLKLILVFIAITLIAFGSVNDLIGGLNKIRDGTCTNMWSYFNMFPHPMCTFYKNTTMAIAGALMGNTASIGYLGGLVSAIVGAPLTIYKAVDPIVSIILPIIRVMPGIEYVENGERIANYGGKKSRKIKGKKSRKTRKSRKSRKSRTRRYR